MYIYGECMCCTKYENRVDGHTHMHRPSTVTLAAHITPRVNKTCKFNRIRQVLIAPPYQPAYNGLAELGFRCLREGSIRCWRGLLRGPCDSLPHTTTGYSPV